MKDELPDWYKSRLREGEPIAGFYRRRLVKGGPFVPVLIFQACPMDPWSGEPMVRSRPLLCLVNGQVADPFDQWTWVCGQPISEAEYLYLSAVRQHAEAYEPDLPEANPRRKIDRLTTPPPRF